MTRATAKTLLAIGAAALAIGPAIARDPATPEQRIGRLEKQVRQVQRVVFPKGQPADTAALDDTPAATQDSVNALVSRIDALEKQMADLVRGSEENGNRVAQLEAELARTKADDDQRLRALETKVASTPPAAAPDPGAADPAQDVAPVDDSPAVSRPKVESGKSKGKTAAKSETSGPADMSKPDEQAYDKGFKLWQAGKYDAAYTALMKMAKDYPDSHRVSWAQNLAGRAQLDAGHTREAAGTLLANYRRDPEGERAQDSLYYLGQALVKLKQPSKACNAYGELESVYAGKMRADIKKLLPAAKAEAKCD
ncbi:tetratricopeptide repeat protein [Sphingomonas sp. ASV193]|uniref:tetratricopeptide repeat protein n=1 Tax=Sphingomonas sp. ASV193 TaxID=3144405 RepID=UPI0032E89EB1